MSISNVLILLISSPKNSILYGLSLEKEKTSTIPPLTEKSPGSETKSSLLKFNSNSLELRLSREIFWFKLISKVSLDNSSASTIFSAIALL